MKIFFLIVTLFISLNSKAQSFQSLDELQPHEEFDNILVKKVSEDSLSTSFVIWVKNSVKPHYHKNHTENIVVLEGEAVMILGESLFVVKKGDFVAIPKGTIHSVTQVLSKIPLKVLSIQTPLFNGADRIFVEHKSDY